MDGSRPVLIQKRDAQGLSHFTNTMHAHAHSYCYLWVSHRWVPRAETAVFRCRLRRNDPMGTYVCNILFKSRMQTLNCSAQCAVRSEQCTTRQSLS